MTDHGVLPGNRVEVHHHGHWLPFLVTHIAEDGGLDGVAFSGRYPAHDWSRPVMDVRNAKRADDAGEPVQATWRPAPGPSFNATVEAAVEAALEVALDRVLERQRVEVDIRIAEVDARIVAAIAAIPTGSGGPPPSDVATDPPAEKAPKKKAPAKKASAKDGS